MIEGDNGRSEGVGKGGSAPPLPSKLLFYLIIMRFAGAGGSVRLTLPV
jgi:hypothetical protein